MRAPCILMNQFRTLIHDRLILHQSRLLDFELKKIFQNEFFENEKKNLPSK
jgi:hypothetical protein